MMETVLNIGLNDESVAGPGQAGRQRAVRLGLLPPADPDVRQDRARHRRRALRGRARRGQDGQGHRRTTSTSTPPTCSSSSTRSRSIVTRARRPRLPAGPARADGPRHPGGLRLLERRPRHPLPPPGAHPGRPRHRGQRLLDGLRQPRHGLRHRRRVHPRPGHRRTRASTATTCRTPRARTSSPASATRVPLQDLESIDKPSYDELHADHGRRSRTTTATCATSSSPSSAASSGCCRPGSASAPRRAAFRIATQLVDQGLIDLDEALQRVTGAQLAQLMFPRFDDDARQAADRQGHERLAGRGGRQGRLRLRHRASSGRARARRSSWSAARPTPTTCDGMIAAAGHPHLAAAARPARRRRRPRHGQDLRLRRRGARRRHQAPQVHRARRHRRRGGRRHLHRRHHRRGLPRRGAGRAVARSCEYFEGDALGRRRRRRRWSRPCTGS